MAIRVLIADSSEERREDLRAMLASDPEVEVVDLASAGQETLLKAQSLRPDIVLLSDNLGGQDGFDTSERLMMAGMPPETILLCAKIEPETLRRAMRAGARECLTYPLGPGELRACIRQVSIDHLRRSAPNFASEPIARGNLIAVTGAKGGVGKTTLAVNLAAALAVRTGDPVLLMDLYTQFGDAALMLNLTPRRTLGDLLAITSEGWESEVLDDYLERHDCGLSLLAGASKPLPPEALSSTFLTAVLDEARRKHHTIVLDIPPLLTETTRCALAQADTILLVANLFDLTTLANTRLWLDSVCASNVSDDAVQVVLNRVSPRNHLSQNEIERILGRGIFQKVPNDGRVVPASVNAGQPFVLTHSKSRVAQSVFEMAQRLAASEARAAATSQNRANTMRRPRFLSPLLRRGGSV